MLKWVESVEADFRDPGIDARVTAVVSSSVVQTSGVAFTRFPLTQRRLPSLF
jgi:hypothetical protein